MKTPPEGLMKERRRFADEEMINGRGGRLRFIRERSEQLRQRSDFIIAVQVNSSVNSSVLYTYSILLLCM